MLKIIAGITITLAKGVRELFSLVPRPSLTAFFRSRGTTLFAMAAKKSVREGLGRRLGTINMFVIAL